MTTVDVDCNKAQLEEACRRLGVEYERNHKLVGEVDRLKRLLHRLVEEPTLPPEDIAKPVQSSDSDVSFLLGMLGRIRCTRCGCCALDCRKHGA